MYRRLVLSIEILRLFVDNYIKSLHKKIETASCTCEYAEILAFVTSLESIVNDLDYLVNTT